MMRSLFSGVSGLKTHQTRMDVIGNNIANVNTTAYKAQNMVFSDLLYQTTQAASGANADTGRGGINARQIGLGAKTSAISTAITKQGSAQSTNNPWDVMITGESFFIVNSGSQNFFTRDGAFTIDGSGNLVMASTGYRVMGWQVDEETGDIRSDVVSALQVMNRDNLIAEAEATTRAYASGILDKNDTDVHSSKGKVMTLNFFDALGYQYTALMSIHALSEDGKYYVQLDDITNEDGESLKDYYKLGSIDQIATFGGEGSIVNTKGRPLVDGAEYDAANNQFLVEYPYAEILAGYKDNPMLGMGKLTLVDVNAAANATGPTAAGNTIPTVGTTIPQGSYVTMEGAVELDYSVLEEEPYNLLWNPDEKAYYYKDANGVSQKLGLTAADKTQWESILSNLSGTGTSAAKVSLKDKQDPANPAATVPDIEVGSDGKVKLNYSVGMQTTQASTFTKSKGFGVAIPNDAAHQVEILEKAYGLATTENKSHMINFIEPANGHASITTTESYVGNLLEFDTKTGKFKGIGGPDQNSATLNFLGSATNMEGANVDLGHFSTIDIDFASLSNINNGKVSTAGLDSGDGSSDNIGAGRKYGELIGVEIGQDGKIRASYDNGMSRLLGQIAVAKFANAAGLAKAGNNIYQTTMNSGEFDGIGQDITADGKGSMESGILEMSNVDLAGEFTEMITTQRGFQANSRIITTSDSMLEELVNLKR